MSKFQVKFLVNSITANVISFYWKLYYVNGILGKMSEGYLKMTGTIFATFLKNIKLIHNA